MRKVSIPPLWTPDFNGVNDKMGKYGIYSSSAIKKLLQYERNRADREKSFFSVVFFPFVNSIAKSRNVVEILKRYTRFIDHIGWFDDLNVCVLLPHTDLNSAGQFALKISERYAAENMDTHNGVLFHELFIYPETGEESVQEQCKDTEQNHSLNHEKISIL